MRRFAFVALLVLAVVVAGCTTGTPTAAPTQAASEATSAPAKQEATSAPDESGTTISVAGSTTVQPLAEKLATAYRAIHPNVEVTVQGGGSSVGVKSAAQGTADIGAASREVKQSELDEFPNLNVITIARDGIAIVAHPDVAVDDLTIEQVQDIFSGKITNWSEVGGADSLITVVSREEGSGTRGAFEEMVMGEEALIAGTAILQQSNGAVRTTIATTPNSIAYLSFGYLDDSVKTIKVGGVAPTEENAANGSYSIVRPLNMLTSGEPQGAVKAWLEYILSPEGQETVVAEGYLRVN